MPTKLFAAGLAVAVTLSTAAPALAAPLPLTLPALTGQYQVGTTSLHLVDSGRADPWVPQQRRELMVTVDYPVRHAGAAPRAAWLGPGVAAATEEVFSKPEYLNLPPGSVGWAGVKRAARTGLPADPSLGKRPVVLFSPGFGGDREYASVLVDDLASHGYVVVSLSHTGESDSVEFPDGRVVRQTAIEWTVDAMKTAIDTRVADSRFVLDQLGVLAGGGNPDAESRAVPAGLGRTLDLSRVGMFGHSYGGYTTGETMYHDGRVDAGINLDGAMSWSSDLFGDAPYLPGEVTKHGLDRPFLLFGAGTIHPLTGQLVDHDIKPGFDRSWTDFWANQHGWKRDLIMHEGRHHSFTDFQAILPQLAAQVPAARRELFVGTVDAHRSLAAQSGYVSGFFDLHLRGVDLHLRGVDRHLFDGDSPCHPDVRIVA